MKPTTVLGTAVVAAVLALGGVSAASAAVEGSQDADATVGSAEQWGPRLTRSCTRVGDRIAKVEKLQARLHADAGTQGSLAFLQARLDRATAEGRSDQARLLTDRLAIRKDLDARLPDLLVRLKDVSAVCDEGASGDQSGAVSRRSAESGMPTQVGRLRVS